MNKGKLSGKYFSKPRIREVSQIWKFFKIVWFLHHLKALNDRISEWAYFLNLTEQFQRYSNFSALKRGYVQTGLRGNLHIWNGTKKKNFNGPFCHFLGINTHNFVKSDLKFENKCLFCAKFDGAWNEKFFGSQSCDIWGLGPKTSLGQFGVKPLAKDVPSCKSRTIAPIFTNRTSFFPES